MFSLTYVSTASRTMQDSDLDALLRESREWNKSHSLSDLLLYKDGFFMQFLEGEKDEVMTILSKIKRDPRHHSMFVIFHEEREVREFSAWSMGFARLDPNPGSALNGYTELFELPFNSDKFLENPTNALQLLRSFKEELPIRMPSP
jgi:hypothetical protein